MRIAGPRKINIQYTIVDRAKKREVLRNARLHQEAIKEQLTLPYQQSMSQSTRIKNLRDRYYNSVVHFDYIPYEAYKFKQKDFINFEDGSLEDHERAVETIISKRKQIDDEKRKLTDEYLARNPEKVKRDSYNIYKK